MHLKQNILSILGFLKAKLAFATEKYEEVILACTEELNLSESESSYKLEALSLRASFYFLTGQFKEAVEDLSTIIDTKEADNLIKVNSLIKRASIYMQTERLQECLDDFETAALLGPDVSGKLKQQRRSHLFNFELLLRRLPSPWSSKATDGKNGRGKERFPKGG